MSIDSFFFQTERCPYHFVSSRAEMQANFVLLWILIFCLHSATAHLYAGCIAPPCYPSASYCSFVPNSQLCLSPGDLGLLPPPLGWNGNGMGYQDYHNQHLYPHHQMRPPPPPLYPVQQPYPQPPPTPPPLEYQRPYPMPAYPPQYPYPYPYPYPLHPQPPREPDRPPVPKPDPCPVRCECKRGDKGDKGEKGEKGEKGDRGEKGDCDCKINK